MKNKRDMTDVKNWCVAYDAESLEDKVKFNIASQCEGYLNGCRDCGYEPLTKEEWKNYIYNGMQDEFETSDGCYVGKQAGRQLHFYGKKNTMKLIEEYLEKYEDIQDYITK